MNSSMIFSFLLFLWLRVPKKTGGKADISTSTFSERCFYPHTIGFQTAFSKAAECRSLSRLKRASHQTNNRWRSSWLSSPIFFVLHFEAPVYFPFFSVVLKCYFKFSFMQRTAGCAGQNISLFFSDRFRECRL